MEWKSVQVYMYGIRPKGKLSLRLVTEIKKIRTARLLKLNVIRVKCKIYSTEDAF